MKKKTVLDLSVIWFAALVAICLMSASLVVYAQGWRAGEPKTSVGSQPGDAKKPAATANSTSRTKAKSGKVARTSANAASSREPKAKPSSAKASTPGKTTPETKEMKASRERLVNHNKSADANARSGGASAKKWAVKGEKVTGDTRVARSGRCNPDDDERIDLSGAYNGDVNYPNGGLSGDATLTITGNRFTLRTGSKTESGNITAVTTCSYTAVAMMFGEWRTPKPGETAAPPLPMLSLTATRKGDQLILKSSPSERREFSFAPAAKK